MEVVSEPSQPELGHFLRATQRFEPGAPRRRVGRPEIGRGPRRGVCGELGAVWPIPGGHSKRGQTCCPCSTCSLGQDFLRAVRRLGPGASRGSAATLAGPEVGRGAATGATAPGGGGVPWRRAGWASAGWVQRFLQVIQWTGKPRVKQTVPQKTAMTLPASFTPH